jgi:rhodanese-related sulfurtransferase
LKQWLAAKDAVLIIDVVPREHFEHEHVPGARCACVYEVNFVDQVRALTPDKSKPIVVYGTSANSKASLEAARKLVEAGYTNVRDFRGGLAKWKRAGLPVEGNGEPEAAPPKLPDRAYALDIERSGIEWVGRNLANRHAGTLRFASGELRVKRGAIVGGHLVLDMKSIADSDIEDRAMRQLLVKHLMSDDFFDVARFPEARFAILETKAIGGCTPGAANYMVNGVLQMKGVERPLSFPAVIGAMGGELVAQAHLDFDRTLWNVIYGSGKVFEKLGRHLVNDLVSVQLKIVAR